MTIFDVFQLTCTFGGMTLGFLMGHRHFGLAGGIVGVVVGMAVGVFVGRLPLALSLWWLKRDLKQSSIAGLKSKLDRQFYLSHLIIAELVVRGEPVESFKSYVLALLHSDAADKRNFGWNNLRIWFPELAEKMEGFKPSNPTEECERRLKGLDL
jgi:hypothetical protein